jgi:Mrp family chromosome partitioning ATPase
MADLYEALERADKENTTSNGDARAIATTPAITLEGIPDHVAGMLFGLHNSLVSQMNEGSRIFAFVGTTESAGASLLTCRFAQFVSRLFQKRTLYVNVNPARTGTGIFPELAQAGGLSEVAKGTSPIESVVRAAGSHGLHVTSLSLGDLDYVGPLLESEGLKKCLADLRDRYDMVLLDPPSAAETSEAIALAPLIDGVVLVVHAENTRWQVAAQLQDRIEMQGGRTLGCVLNKRCFHIPDFIYKRL